MKGISSVPFESRHPIIIGFDNVNSLWGLRELDLDYSTDCFLQLIVLREIQILAGQ